MYAGLTTADKGALLDAKARGAEWVARDKNIVLGGFKHEPTRKTIMLPNGTSSTTTWNDEVEDFWIELNDCDLSFVTWSLGAVNIDLALAQIAEMESAENPSTPTPLTWNERINQMTVEEKAQWLLIDFPKLHKKAYDYAWKNRKAGKFSQFYKERMSELLNSPHTEGATK